jgi:hypothetical protein
MQRYCPAASRAEALPTQLPSLEKIPSNAVVQSAMV